MYARRFQRAELAFREEFFRLGALRGEERRLTEARKAFVARAMALFLQKADQAKRQEEGIRRQKQDGEPPTFLTRIFRRFRRN